MYDSTVPKECATSTRVSSATTDSMRARRRSRRSGSVSMTFTMSTVRSKVASLAACPSAARVSAPCRSDSASITPARDCCSWRSSSLPGWCAEEVAVEADIDVVAVELHPVVPQPVAHGWQPARLEFVGSPQLVERAVDQDDGCHERSACQMGGVVVAPEDPALGSHDEP